MRSLLVTKDQAQGPGAARGLTGHVCVAGAAGCLWGQPAELSGTERWGAPVTAAHVHANPMGSQNAPSFTLAKAGGKVLSKGREGRCSPLTRVGTPASRPVPTQLEQPLGGLQAAVQRESQVVDLLCSQAAEEVHARVEVAGQAGPRQAVDECLQGLQEALPQGCLGPVCLGLPQAQHHLAQVAPVQPPQGRVAAADPAQQPQQPPAGPGVAVIQGPQPGSLCGIPVLQPQVPSQPLQGPGQKEGIFGGSSRDRQQHSDRELQALVLHLEQQLLRGHAGPDQAPEEAADGRPVDGGGQGLAEQLQQDAGREVAAHQEAVPGAAPAGTELQLSPAHSPAARVPGHSVQPRHQAPQALLEHHGNQQTHTVGRPCLQPIIERPTGHQRPEGQFRELVPQVSLQLKGNVAGQLFGQSDVGRWDGHVVPLECQQLLLERQAQRCWGAKRRRHLRTGVCGPLCRTKGSGTTLADPIRSQESSTHVSVAGDLAQPRSLGG
uniref:Uncharacterized protein n=1 Tax=Mustela putorius furo TaxID=9669 RepID=M3Z6N7_MUSPF